MTGKGGEKTGTAAEPHILERRQRDHQRRETTYTSCDTESTNTNAKDNLKVHIHHAHIKQTRIQPGAKTS